MLDRSPLAARPAPVVDVRFSEAERHAALRAEGLAGLTSSPKRLSPKWLYDERGSQLFDEITRLPEYYLTRAEREILAARAAEIALLTGADTLVELGSGTSEKTRLLLDALAAAGTLRRFVPFDVSEETLRASADALSAEYPEVQLHAVVGDFERHLGLIPGGGRRLVAFLGSTIGNLDPAERAGFLAGIGAVLHAGDAFLLGVDLVKDPARLEAAYNDSAGVTAAFIRNVLLVLNRELGASFDPERFEHAASWDEENEWMDLRLRSSVEQAVPVAALGVEVLFRAGEEMRTEISAKFRREGIEAELRAAGLAPARFWTDAAGDFGLVLAMAAS